MTRTKSEKSFDEVCEETRKNNPLALAYKISDSNIKRPLFIETVSADSGQKSTLVETIREIMRILFPSDNTNSETLDNQTMRAILTISYRSGDEPPFSIDEVTAVVNSLKKKKAPGLDGINSEMIKCLYLKMPGLLPKSFNKCLELGVFPTAWKTVSLVLLNKPGKDKNEAKSYRPTHLLLVLSKLLDKLVTQRIEHHLHSQNILRPQPTWFLYREALRHSFL
ncbi:hypothetical protein AVEN_193173-1 [Araneus ventricosus]|uniref:RNA-directed DNA polymerase from mobile element jockey n=1 Tax=Araneus ventricosus TaxID=182803 RepID=A0A4Y2B3U8_ARAVE|nr:hypothetical protein AVEN_193173-1 [Araneus ventricosus]